ncbi:MAG TPA: HPr(Ser) kinase/phosphatase [Candidatus Cloacimonadota bacterium]|jgi:HPr kinase/phosphorylase|nr:HPr(Ser) kinase/phosphatase [Candidatus Cloacimonadales bacterium]HPY95719.1 HPr(Ser) kinase/phosphatase [Candidatus Cloacimonadota bacterium]HQB41554.1 HPr(Ser) kinase/phosphatase [Candidatus Cloacimonadota bacterium]
MKELSINDFFDLCKQRFVLSIITDSLSTDKKIVEPHIHRPGLALSGFFDRFPNQRIQLLGETEISYLQSLPEDVLYDRLEEMMTMNIPCFVVSKGLSVPSQMDFIANEKSIPIIVSRLSTEKLYWGLSRFLRDYFSPDQSVHGTLVEVFGVGVMLTGRSGIGKSECALELIERKHRLITDDVVRLKQQDDKLFGFSTKDIGHFMEIRGVGIIDVERMFGIEAIRKESRVDIQVELMPWRENMDYERIGLTNQHTEHLGMEIPCIYLPVSPGKNVSVIIEVIAMNHILKTYGYDGAEAMQRKLAEEMQQKTRQRTINTQNN